MLDPPGSLQILTVLEKERSYDLGHDYSVLRYNQEGSIGAKAARKRPCHGGIIFFLSLLFVKVTQGRVVWEENPVERMPSSDCL